MELLISIAIIAVLATLLLPVLSQIGERGRVSACVGNLRQIGAGIFAYAADTGTALPAERSAADTPANGARYWEAILVSGGYLSVPLHTSATDLTGASVFRCPSGLADKAFQGSRTDFSDPAYATSDDAQRYRVVMFKSEPSKGSKTVYMQSWYGINAITNNAPPPYPFWVTQTMTNADGSTLFSITGGRPLATIPNAGKVIGIYCGIGFHNGAMARVAARHQNRTTTNVMFMDGHVETVPNKDLQAAGAEFNVRYSKRVYKNLSFTTNFDD